MGRIYARIIAASLSVALLSCSGAPELLPAERAAGDAVASAWSAAGLPPPTQGRCDLSTFAVRLATPEQFVTACWYAPGTAYGCLAWESTAALFAWREYPVVVVSPRWHSEPGVIAHELLHARIKCSGLEPFGDTAHRDPRIWEAVGGATSVQARALAILAGNQ